MKAYHNLKPYFGDIHNHCGFLMGTAAWKMP
jgi:hypothetical protein